MMLVPFAMEIFRRHLNGETVEQLSADLGIPPERIDQRLRAAAAYTERHPDIRDCYQDSERLADAFRAAVNRTRNNPQDSMSL